MVGTLGGMTNPPGEGQPPQDPNQNPQQQPQQPGYWPQQGPQQPYGQVPGYPPQVPVQYAPDHPKATTSLVLGILGVVLCQVIAPFAWSIGKKTLNEIDASNGMMGGRGSAQAGYVLGIVGSVLLILGVVFFVIWLIFAIALIGGSATSTY